MWYKVNLRNARCNDKNSKYTINEPWKCLVNSVANQNWSHKNFFNAKDRNSAGLMYLKNNGRIKEGVIVGLQIRESIQDGKFKDTLTEVEKQHGNHSKVSRLIVWEMIRQKTVRHGVWPCTILQNYEVQSVFKYAILTASLRLLPRKFEGSERWARRLISPGYFHHGKATPR